MDAVCEELESCATKTSKVKGKKKALVVKMKDLQPVDNRGKGKGGKKLVGKHYNKVTRQILPLSVNRSSLQSLH